MANVNRIVSEAYLLKIGSRHC